MAEEKKNWLGPYIPEGNILREVVQQIKLVYHLMLDARVRPLVKVIPVVALLYVVSPVDLIADVIPVLGQMDDAAIVMFGLRMFFELAPADVVREHLKRLARPLTDSEWKVVQNPAEAVPPEPTAAQPAPEVVEGNFKLNDTVNSGSAPS